MVSEAAGMTAPIEMSSSPAIISRPTGSATMPISAATFSQLEKPAALTKYCAASDREEHEDCDQAQHRTRLRTACQLAKR